MPLPSVPAQPDVSRQLSLETHPLLWRQQPLQRTKLHLLDLRLKINLGLAPFSCSIPVVLQNSRQLRTCSIILDRSFAGTHNILSYQTQNAVE